MIDWLRRHLPFRLAIVDGDSMLPTLRHGDWLLFLRRPFSIGQIVLADLDPREYIVKRVAQIKQCGNLPVVTLAGDNAAVSGTYLVRASDIMGVALCRIWRNNA